MAGFAEDYVGVPVRVQEFFERYPDGSIQTEIVTHTDALVVVKAYAYRTADDARPSTGHSQLGIPGKTPYTRDSELENCETSAVGRALAFLGFATKDSLASREEVQNKANGSLSSPTKGDNGATHPATHAGVNAVMNMIRNAPPAGTSPRDIKEATAIALSVRPSEINKDIMADFLAAWLEQPGNTASAFQKKFLQALTELRERELSPA